MSGDKAVQQERAAALKKAKEDFLQVCCALT
jgi:hypothetical protein